MLFFFVYLRIEECIANGNSKNFFIGIDGGKCLADKQQRMKLLNPTLPSSKSCTFPTTNWANFPSQAIPRSFCYAIMYNYITTGPIDTLDLNATLSDDDEQLPNCGNSKALQRGRQYCLSDFVSNMEDNANDLAYYLRADVQSSFRVTVKYKISIALDKNSSKIINAQCQCPASPSENCSHIVALLYKLEDYTVRYGYDALTCTSKLKEWNKGKKLFNNLNHKISYFMHD